MDHHCTTSRPHNCLDEGECREVSLSSQIDRTLIRESSPSPRMYDNTQKQYRRRHSLRRSSWHSSSTLCFILVSIASFCSRSQAFSSSSPTTLYQSRIQEDCLSMKSIRQLHRENTKLYMSAVIEPQPSSSRMSDFQRRMKGIVKRNGIANGKRSVGSSRSERPKNLKVVHTLEEYKEQLDESNGKIVIVRFFATWCKACKAVQPSFYRMASLYPHITFLDVPVTNHNANLHQGLEVPSLPYGHIYHPDAGLVEEMKISKKYFPALVKKVRWYDEGLCGLDEFVPEIDDRKDAS